MITVNPVKFTNNNSRKYITFQESNNRTNFTPSVTLLPLQSPNARINFEKDLERTNKSDAVQSNPVIALGYKFIKTYNILFSPNQNKTNTNSQQISFLG